WSSDVSSSDLQIPARRIASPRPRASTDDALLSLAVEGFRTEGSELASAAVFAGPNAVEALLRGVEQEVVGRREPHLEVALTCPSSPQPGAGEVGAPHVQVLTVHRDHLQMDAWARAQLETRRLQASPLGERLPKRARGRRGVQHAHLDAAAGERSEGLHDRDVAAARAGHAAKRRLEAHVLE